MNIEFVVIDEGNCDVTSGVAVFDKHFQQRMIGWLSQGWSVRVWPVSTPTPA